MAGQTTTSEAPVDPFSAVTIGDPNSGATDTLTITLSGAGGTLTGADLINDGDGAYTLAAASATTITKEVEALVFTPIAGAPGTSSLDHNLHPERREQRLRHRHSQQHDHGDRHQSGAQRG